jgi:hypothetical protein
MTPRRILLVGNFDRKALGRHFFNTDHKLLNGFIRLGHFALPFSDRDVAREVWPWRSSRLGRAGMNRRLLETARHFLPHLVLFFHSDLVTAETFEALRRVVPDAALAQVNVDSTERLRTMAAFTARAAHLDVSFITTACPEALRAISPRPGAVAFMPNPVDPSVETAQVWAVPRDRLTHDVLFLGNGDHRRPEQIAALRAALPEDVRFMAGGGIHGTPRLSSTAFLDALATAAQSPALPLDDRVPVPWLYSSNRLAILLGQGLVAHVPASARQEDLYEDGVVSFDGPEALAEACTRLARDDAARRRIGERGWRLARERTGCDRVAAYLLETALGETPSAWPWPIERW